MQAGFSLIRALMAASLVANVLYICFEPALRLQPASSFAKRPWSLAGRAKAENEVVDKNRYTKLIEAVFFGELYSAATAHWPLIY